jgi:phage/plasmid-associated DNA primase
MKHIIEKIDGFSSEQWDVCIGASDKSIPAAKEPQSVATVIEWACRETGSQILTLGGQIHIWNGSYYERDKVGRLFNSLVVPTLKVLKLYLSQANSPDFLRQVEKALSHATGMTGNELDSNPRGLNFKDGVLLMTRNSVEFINGHTPDRVFTYCLPFNYKGDRKKSKVWRPFIEQIVPNEELRRYVLASFANSIACDPMDAQRMLLLMGVGASGKSTLIDAVVAAIGTSNACRVDDLRNLTKDESRYRMDLATNILCVCGDASGNIGNKDVLKQIISKEELSGRRLFREIEYFTPRASLIVASNEIGFTHALGDSGISRRIDIIQFDHPVAEKDRDPHIGAKLAAPEEQREMIMDMLDAIIEMQNEYGKMVRPEALASLLRDLMYDGDSFLGFLGWCGLETAGKNETGTSVEVLAQSALLDAYNRFAGEYNSATIGMRTMKGKCRTNGSHPIGRRGSTHDFMFRVVDNDLFVKNFSQFSPENKNLVS